MTDNNKNRLRIVHVHEGVIAHMVLADHNVSKDICLSAVHNFPIDAELRGVRHDFAERVFAFKFSHESFDEIPEGEVIPTASLLVSQYRLLLTDEQQKEIKAWRRNG